MGEATYYLKARYPTVQAAEQAASDLRDLVAEGQQAYDFWQQRRGDTDRARFWTDFKSRFPLVVDYLTDAREGGKPVLDGDPNNDPAGHLDFGNEEELSFNLEQNGTLVTFYALCWHFAEWDTLVAWLIRVTGATKASWISDEYIEPPNPFDCIDV